MAIIRDLYFYPIKSFRGIRLSEMSLDKAGPRWDREWMLVDEKNKFLTQREHPELAKIGVRVEEDSSVELSLPGRESVDFGLEEHEGSALEVTVWKDKVAAFEVSGEVSEWIGEFLGKKVKLVRLNPEAHRAFDEFPENGVRFVDSKPLLVISQASLKQLEQMAGVTLSMSRFRPNIVLDGVDAHAEDAWSGFKTNGIEFKPLKACTRCKITTVHPLTGQTGDEPLKTLATYRKGDKGITFGFYYAHLKEGRLKVGSEFTLV